MIQWPLATNGYQALEMQLVHIRMCNGLKYTPAFAGLLWRRR